MNRALLLLLWGCHPEKADETGAVAEVDPMEPGPYAPGLLQLTLDRGDRQPPLWVWYPATGEAPPADPVALLDPAHTAEAEALYASAPADCPRRSVSDGRGLPVAEGGPWPAVALSHCYGCLASNLGAVAEQLASHGFVVLAPEHSGDTLWDQQAGSGLPLNTDTLALRLDDLAAAVDAQGELDLPIGRVGVMGHSFGAVTAGALLQARPDTIAGGLFVGAPIENPILPGVEAAAITAPTLFLLLEEDHSIGALGNTLIEQNVASMGGPTTLARMADAGHWSPSDLVGLTPGLMPGCGEDLRQEGGAAFAYIEPDGGRALTGALAVAFFDGLLRDGERGGAWLEGDGATGLTWER